MCLVLGSRDAWRGRTLLRQGASVPDHDMFIGICGWKKRERFRFGRLCPSVSYRRLSPAFQGCKLDLESRPRTAFEGGIIISATYVSLCDAAITSLITTTRGSTLLSSCVELDGNLDFGGCPSSCTSNVITGGRGSVFRSSRWLAIWNLDMNGNGIDFLEGG